MNPEPNNTNLACSKEEAALKKDEKKDENLLIVGRGFGFETTMELYVERVSDPDLALQKVVLESTSQEIRTSMSSMTSVTKPLKFLRPHYPTLKGHYETTPDSDLKKLLADILSVLALTMLAGGKRERLKYRLLGSDF